MHYGPEEVHAIDDPFLEHYHPEYYLPAFRKAYDDIQPCAVVIGHTLQAIDLAPRIAFDLDAGLITDCTGIEADSDDVIFLKPVFSSHVLAGYTTSPPFIVTIRSKAFDPARRRPTKQCKASRHQVKLDGLKPRAVCASRMVHEQAGIKIEDAETIVAGSRGIGSVEGFGALAELAEVLSAAIGASRPPVDLGWIPAAAIAAGADALMVEVHTNPDRALSDGQQSLYPDQFEQLMKEVDRVYSLTTPSE